MKLQDAERVLADTAPDLLAYFRRRVASVEDAADLVNDTVIAAWRTVSRMPSGDEQARMWIFGVARNILRRHGRSQARRDALTARLASTLDSHPWSDDDAGIEVRAAIDALPSELAELVRLVHWDGFSLEQAAILMKTPASTTRTRHARAKELLRAALASPRERVEVSAMNSL
ncbi:sigma-70 family RNA polymerase sigma factor [Salinibacterium sp. ZJ454]|uniref:RNA polymerase sigma factor n=1 Tax=Salinibacterium sp. ZJ454 TaxID=2708339 RepID=UPI0014243B0C|nr:sigma-70 family RNA polymerase sigma factor [Salinibacterium sp. ZJ454]